MVGRVSLARVFIAALGTSRGGAPEAVMGLELQNTNMYIICREGKGLQPVAPIANMDNFPGNSLRPRVATWKIF